MGGEEMGGVEMGGEGRGMRGEVGMGGKGREERGRGGKGRERVGGWDGGGGVRAGPATKGRGDPMGPDVPESRMFHPQTFVDF